MKLEKDGYVFIITLSIENIVIVMIVDKEKDKVVDVATLEMRIYSELDNSLDFDVKSLFDRAPEVFEKTKAAVDIFLEINRVRTQSNNKNTV